MAEKKFYLTKEGLQKIKKEYGKLLKMKRLKAKGGVPSVLHSEELSAEFIAYREDLDLLESKIEELEHILKNFELIKLPLREERSKVNLGAQVLLEVDGQKDEFMIVGTLEANPSLGKISNESPVGRALLGHRVGDEVVVSSPIRVSYKVIKIRYPSL